MSRTVYDENCTCEDCVLDRELCVLLDKLSAIQDQNTVLRAQLNELLLRFVEKNGALLDNLPDAEQVVENKSLDRSLS